MRSPKAVARAYFDCWTERRFDEAAALIAETATFETPINAYPRKADFVAALAGFGALVENTRTLAELAEGEAVIQVYDMDVAGLGTLRIAEHFTIRDGAIVALRQVHDTAALRAAGFVRP